MTTLPTGEKLPDYDGPADGVDIDQVFAWLKTRRDWNDGQTALTGYQAHQTIRDVLAALQVVGDATLVKNATYRAMRKEGADIEHLSARLANTGHSDLIIENGGPVGAVIAILDNLDITAPAPVAWPT